MSDDQFHKVLAQKTERCPIEQLDAVTVQLAQASCQKQECLIAKHRWGEPAMLKYPDPPSSPLNYACF